MLSLHSIPGAFSDADCDRVLEIVRAEKARDARLVGQNKDHNIRRADLVWIDEVEGAEWVMDRIISTVAEANREVYDFALSDFAESAQVARYGAEREGHFDWHSDIGEGPIAGRRKLTMVVQLSPDFGCLPNLEPKKSPRCAAGPRFVGVTASSTYRTQWGELSYSNARLLSA